MDSGSGMQKRLHEQQSHGMANALGKRGKTTMLERINRAGRQGDCKGRQRRTEQNSFVCRFFFNVRDFAKMREIKKGNILWKYCHFFWEKITQVSKKEKEKETCFFSSYLDSDFISV
jgi:hypothetical protein